MLSSEKIKGGLEMLANGAIVLVGVLLVWTQLIRPDPTMGEPVEALEDVTMSMSLLTKRMGSADRILLEFSALLKRVWVG